MDGAAFTFAFIVACILFGGGAAGIAHDYGKRPAMLAIPALLCIGGGLAVISGVVTQPASSGFAGASAAALLTCITIAAVLAAANYLREP